MIENQDSTEELVEIIEQKDGRARIFVALAAGVGLVVGGLLGTIYAQNKWQAVIHHYQEQTELLNQEFKTLTASVQEEKQQAQESLVEYQKLAQQQAETQSQEQVAGLNQQAIELEKANDALLAKVVDLEKQLLEQQQQTSNLENRLSLQVSIYERARELFRKEEQISRQLTQLETQQQALRPQLTALAEECELYLEGKSWDVHSDVCSRHDEMSSQISQNDQMIAIYRLDLREIEALTQELGLQ